MPPQPTNPERRDPDEGPKDPTRPRGRGPRGGERGTPRRPNGFFLVAILLAIVVGIAAFTSDPVDPETVEKNRYRVHELLREGHLVEDSLEVVTEPDRTFPSAFRAELRQARGVKTRVQLDFATENEVEALRAELDRLNENRRLEGREEIDWVTKESNAPFWRIFWSSVPWIVFLVILYFLFVRQLRAPGAGGNVLSFGRSRARLATHDATRVTFADVAGAEEGKEEVLEIIEFLKSPARFQKLGGRIPRGVMLVGSPGTGKTLLAKAIAGEAGVPFFSICGSDFVEMFVGVGASRVRDMFRQARENSPCILFLDEVDAVGRRRGTGLGGGHDEREQTLNAILVEMDGFDSDEGIIMIAATNRPDVLDPALLRPGRFDREIVMDLPDQKGREEILKVHSRNVRLATGVDLGRVARATPGFSGAELASLVNEAAIIAVMRDDVAVREEHLEEARDKLRWGRQKKSRALTDEDKRITAYHEAGHALIAHVVDDVEPLHKVTIIPRGRALGATIQLPERDRYHYSRREARGNLVLLYAGRIAEEMFCGDVTSGASNDIERATDLARRMVCEWGMSEGIGPINYSDGEETIFLGREVTRTQNHSEATAMRIDEDVRKIVDEAYRTAEKLLKKHRAAIERVARALMEKETLTGEEVAALIENRFRRSKEVSGAEPDTLPDADAGASENAEDVSVTDPV